MLISKNCKQSIPHQKYIITVLNQALQINIIYAHWTAWHFWFACSPLVGTSKPCNEGLVSCYFPHTKLFGSNLRLCAITTVALSVRSCAHAHALNIRKIKNESQQGWSDILKTLMILISRLCRPVLNKGLVSSGIVHFTDLCCIVMIYRLT